MTSPSLSLVLYDGEDGKNVLKRFPIDQDSLSIGRKDADIILDDSSVSRKHALLTFAGGEVTVEDLGSRNGVFINNKKISQGKLVGGDTLSVGKVKMKVESEFDDDKTATATMGLSDSARRRRSPLKTVIIDGEHCNILFDDERFDPSYVLNTLSWNLQGRDYIDISEEKDTGDIIAKHPQENAIEIITTVGRAVISVEYLPLKTGTYYVDREPSGRKVLGVSGLVSGKHPFLEISGEETGVLEIPGLEMRRLHKKGDRSEVLTGPQQLSREHSLVFEQGVNQLFVRYAKSPPLLKKTPFVTLKKQDIKMFLYSTVLLGIMSLFAYFFDSRIPKPEEKNVSVVHKIRPKPKPKVKRPTKPTTTKKQPEQKISTQSSPIPKKADQAIKMPRKKPKTITKKQKNIKKEGRVQKAEKKVVKKKNVPTPKSYNFSKSTATKLKNLFKKTDSTGAPRIVKNTSIDSQSFSKVREVSGKGRGTASDKGNSFGKLGDGYKGEYDLSEGSSGLSSKGGIDRLAYESPQVLIKGGIDLNALRRILKELIPQMRYCYQQELARNSSIQGVFNLMFRITASGKAVNVKIKGDGPSFTRKGTKCLANALQRAVFPKPKGGGVADINQSLDFSKN